MASLVLLVSCALPGSQQPAKARRIGWLQNQSLQAVLADVQDFVQRMRELGYIEDRDFVLEVRAAEGRRERVPELASELVQLPVDVIVAVGTVPTSAARAATSSIPVVMAPVEDPVGAGFIASLASPGGNVTGLSSMVGQLNGKRLELLREALPGISSVAVLWNPAIRERVSEFQEVQVAARTLGLQAPSLEVREASELAGAFDAAAAQRVDAVLLVDNLVTSSNQDLVAVLAMKHRLPMMSQRQDQVQAGGLMAYASHLPEIRRRAATYVDRLLRGESPGILPVGQPTKFDFVINLKTAKTLGLTVPQSVLLQATQVVE